MTAKLWWIWLIGCLSILLGFGFMERSAMSVVTSPGPLPALGWVFLSLHFVSGLLWFAGGIGFLLRRSWGRLSLVWATTVELARALLTVISFFIFTSGLHGQVRLWMMAMGVFTVWIAAVFLFGRFLRSDKARSAMIEDSGVQTS